jgi:riboflavin kinase/FMN adenylyltransferase
MVMKIYNNANLSKKHFNSVIAIGNFDGLHLGHQKVINEAKQKAKKYKLPFGVMTFEPVPMMFFSKIKKDHRINSLQQKKEQFKKLKLDFLIIIKFNKKFSSLTAEEFIRKIIYKKTKCKYLYVSKNFKFGFKRKGNIQTLKKFENKFNYKNIITKPYKKNNKTISSTFIRNKIRAGNVELANKLLNRNWCVAGKVIKGKKRGRKIGFPTCNVNLNNYVIPKLGVYAVRVNTNNFNKNGVANIGYRPTFNGQNLLLETNIFGINKNLYNKVINVSFKKFIRKEKKFKNFEYLKKQIRLDIKQAKK